MDLVENVDEAEERNIELSWQRNVQMLSDWCERQERRRSATQEADSTSCHAENIVVVECSG